MKNLFFLLIVILSMEAFTQVKSDKETKTLLIGKWKYEEYNLILKKNGKCEIEWGDGVTMNSTWALNNGILIVNSYTRTDFRYFNSKIYKYKIIAISNKEIRFYHISPRNSKKMISVKKLDM